MCPSELIQDDVDDEDKEEDVAEMAVGPSQELEAVSRAAVECLQHLLINRSQLNTDRAAGFARQLLSISLHTMPHVALATNAVVSGLVQRFPKLGAMMDTERGAFGQYRPDVADPEYCNALSSTAWEVSLLATHYHPLVASYAKCNAAHSKPPASLATTGALDLFRLYNSAPGGTFDLRPAMQQPPRSNHQLKKRPLALPDSPDEDDWIKCSPEEHLEKFNFFQAMRDSVY